MFKPAPLVNTTPEVPDALTPSNARPSKRITSLAPALMTMPLVPGEGITPAPPAALPKMVIALVMVTGPKSPGSSTLISPPAMVCVSAVAKVRQGDDRVHGLESLPEAAETQVRLFGGSPLVVNAADTLSVALIVTEQPPVPVQAPLQPIKLMPWAGVAVKVT